MHAAGPVSRRPFLVIVPARWRIFRLVAFPCICVRPLDGTLPGIVIDRPRREGIVGKNNGLGRDSLRKALLQKLFQPLLCVVGSVRWINSVRRSHSHTYFTRSMSDTMAIK